MKSADVGKGTLNRAQGIALAADGTEGRDAGLQYPCAAPGPHQASEVAPGVKWLRMPLPGAALDHINVWAIEDGPGWTLVDTGLQCDAAAAAWTDVLENVLGGKPVTRVIVTHMHPDHVGMAQWLTQRFACPLWMTRLEYLSCRSRTADSHNAVPAGRTDFYRAAGWSAGMVDANRHRFNTLGTHLGELPDSYQRMRDGQEIVIGERPWQVVTGAGHSPESACLYSPQLRLFISGDQVLPRISSNLSVYPTEPDEDPLGDWLASLIKLQQRVPGDVLVLPGHNDCFRGLHRRLADLRSSHERALLRLQDALVQPCRVIDVFDALFKRPVPVSDGLRLMLATGEGIAFLNHLMALGLATRQMDSHGVHWYRRSRSVVDPST